MPLPPPPTRSSALASSLRSAAATSDQMDNDADAAEHMLTCPKCGYTGPEMEFMSPDAEAPPPPDEE